MTRDERNSAEHDLAEWIVEIEHDYKLENKPPIHSRHEAWALIREEYKEAKEEMDCIRDELNDLEYAISLRDAVEDGGYNLYMDILFDIRNSAVSGLIELARVAAIAQRAIDAERIKYELREDS